MILQYGSLRTKSLAVDLSIYFVFVCKHIGKELEENVSNIIIIIPLWVNQVVIPILYKLECASWQDKYLIFNT